ncbi:MAG: T9SS type A sorting domain-containing protein [Brumimicrobium sp.]|nr:T9SS type A sorting domain-containing protein [Brumimicrobium sp.]
MKKLLLLSALILTVSGISQVFTPITNDTTLYGSANQSDFYGDITIGNEVNATQSMYWEVDSTNVPANWEFSVCTPTVCYPTGTAGSSWNLSSNGGYLNVHFYPNGVVGEGFIILKVYDTPGSSQVEFLTFRGNTLSAAIKESNLENLSVYPNPATSVINLKGKTSNATYKMVDILGKEVKTGILSSGGKSQIDVSQLLTGIYFLTVQEGKNQITRKIIVN